MRKKLLLAVCAGISMSAMATTQVLFDGTQNDAWTFASGSTVEYTGGNAVVTMGVQPNGEYRADVQYRGDGITFNPASDKYLVIEFVGEKPQANISIEINDPDLDFEKKYLKRNNFQSSNFKAGGHTFVYCELSTLQTDQNEDKVAKTYADAGTFTTKLINIKIANNTQEPHAYTLASIKVGSTLEELGMVPAIMNATSGVGFATLEDAFNAAQEGDVLTINEDINISKRLTVPCPLTIKGANKNVTIKRDYTGIMLLVNASTTFSDLTFASVPGVQANVYMEVNKASATFDNVDFTGIHSSKDQGIIAMRQSSSFFGNDITFTDCSSTNEKCPGFLFLGSGCHVTLGGSNHNVSVSIEKVGSCVSAGENLTATPAIGVSFVNPQGAEIGTKVVEGTRDSNLFKLNGLSGFGLSPAENEENALVIAKSTPAAIDTILVDDSNEEAEYFDLAGRRVANPTNGVYIVKKGSKVSKVVL